MKYLPQGPIAAVVKTISGSNDDGGIANETINMPGGDCMAPAATEPLSMEVLVS